MNTRESQIEIYKKQIILMLAFMLVLVAETIAIMILLSKKTICTVAYVEPIATIEEVINENQQLIANVENESKEQSIEYYMTNYYRGDGSSSNRVGSGFTTNDFEINELGWYTFNGRVVIAAATYQGLNSKYGVLANYMIENPNIKYFNYFDEIKFLYDGKLYEAIILDTCGASMELQSSDEGLNRIDVFISDSKYAFGKSKVILKVD